MPGATAPSLLIRTLKYLVVGWWIVKRWVLNEEFMIRHICRCGLCNSKPPKCTTDGFATQTCGLEPVITAASPQLSAFANQPRSLCPSLLLPHHQPKARVPM